MSQYRGSRVVVTNGQTKVRQIGELNGVASAPFSNGEDLSWTGGAGRHVRDTGSTLELYRTSGVVPSVGLTITGSGDVGSGVPGSGSTFTVSSIPVENLSLTTPRAAYPANYSTSGGSQGSISSNDEFVIAGQPIQKVGTVGVDEFDLAMVWGGDPLVNVEAVIHRDRTVNKGFLLPKTGSRVPFGVIEETIRLIDLEFSLLTSSPPSDWELLTLVTPWIPITDVSEPRPSLSWSHEPNGQVVRLKGYIETSGLASPNTNIVAAGGLPVGKRPLERLDYDRAGVRFSINPDGSIKYRGPLTTPSPTSFNDITFRAEQ